MWNIFLLRALVYVTLQSMMAYGAGWTITTQATAFGRVFLLQKKLLQYQAVHNNVTYKYVLLATVRKLEYGNYLFLAKARIRNVPTPVEEWYALSIYDFLANAYETHENIMGALLPPSQLLLAGR